MTLPKKPLLAIVIIFAGLIGGLYTAASTILLNSLKQAEEQYTRQAVAGVLGAFTQTQDDFNSRFSDWSAWDETYAFVKDANKAYIESNLAIGQLVSLKVHLALVIQPSGRLVYSVGLDRTSQKKTAIPAALRVHLSPQDRLLQHSNTESNLGGIMLLPEGPMLISSRPVLTTEAKGPIRGTLIFGRFIGAYEIAKLSKISRLPLIMHGLNEKKLPPDFQAVRDELSASNPILMRTLSEQTIAGYALIPDIYGKPAVLLRVDVPRDIYRQGKTSLNYLIGSILVLGLLLGGVILLLLRRLVLSQRQHRQSEKRYRTVVKQAAEGIFLVDADTKQIIEINAAFKNLLGYTAAELCKLTLYDVIADNWENIDRNLQQILTGNHFRSEGKYRRQDGLIVDVEVNAILISDNGRNVFCIIIHDITKRKQIEDQLLHNALHDSLTGLANRALFMERLDHTIQLKKRQEDYTFAVLFLDLDRFKVINDNLGHMVGDQLLIAIAQRLQFCLRSSDTFARLGGDEFAILIEDSNNVTQIVERIQQQLNLPFNLNGQEIYATASIGVILNTTGYDQPEALLRDADTAMYRAKAGGKARHEVFDISMHDQAVALLQLENDLQRAVKTCEFQLHYQPIVLLKSNKIIGFEALVRWQHPTRGLISILSP